ncbi:MAG: TetR family transcriptional regulator C-terminal domain-containing protein, partial [Pseudomonadota bacterium]
KDDRHDDYELLRRWLPCSPGRLVVSKAWIAFIGSAQFSSANRALFEDYYRLTILEGRRRLANVPLAMDLDVAADMVLAFFEGLCARVVMEPDAWPAERQEALLETFFKRVLQGTDG